jgi:hypothetical protein
MLEINSSVIDYHSFNVHDGDSLVNQVSKVICVVFPRALLVAGFSEHGDLLMIRYACYSTELPAWILNFYEHRFVEEHLLHNPSRVVASFICTEKYIVVPGDLYEEVAATKWLQSIFFVEANEIFSTYQLTEDDACYMYAWPGTLKSLIGRYFNTSRTLPLACYQFFKPYKADSAIQCCITETLVIATLYKSKNLAWHQVFPYQTGEDIAYQIKLLCAEQGLNSDQVDLHYSVAYKGLNVVLHEMSQYFPNLRDVDASISAGNSRQWGHTISLLQQLYACAL